MYIKPLFDNVLLQQKPSKTSSSLLLPEHEQDRPNEAVVVAVGSGSQELKMQVQVGDTVLFNTFNAHEFSHDDTNYILIKQTDILAVVTKGEI